MTLEEIRASGKAVLTPAEAAGPLRCDPQALRLTAQQHPEKLGFPVVCVGKRTKIPTEPFLRMFGMDTERTEA